MHDCGEDGTVRRLAAARSGEEAFLAPHHAVAADRLERLIERAQLRQRVTMSYDPAAVGPRGRNGNGPETASDNAADARRKLNMLAQRLPPDCWGVLVDVCGLGKGLQQVETERRWPRRSAKLVLRIGLEQLASQLGINPQASGKDTLPARHWRPERLPLISEETP